LRPKGACRRTHDRSAATPSRIGADHTEGRASHAQCLLLPDARGEGHPAFALDVDGTQLIPIVLSGQGTFAFSPGDTAVVRGRYNRANSGAEWIDRTNQVVSRAWSQPGYVIINGTLHQ